MADEAVDFHLLQSRMIKFFDEYSLYMQSLEGKLGEFAQENGYESLAVKQLLISENHVLECIGKNPRPNVTLIANKMSMTRGAISKITKKLLARGLITAERLESNKKEIYFTLTPLGREAFEVHERFHQQFYDVGSERFRKLLENYSSTELETIHRFLNELMITFRRSVK
jgi:DNA-binding MarR family transcriptional regulator